MVDTTNRPDDGANANSNSPAPSPISAKHKRIASKRGTKKRKTDKEPNEQRVREWLTFSVNIALAIVGYLAIRIYGGQLHEMRDADRPWIKIAEVVPKSSGDGIAVDIWDFSDPNNPKDAQWNKGHDGMPIKGAEFWFGAVVKNVGHGPAFHVTSYYELFLPTIGSKGDQELSAEQNRFCSSTPVEDVTDRQAILFPDETARGGTRVSVEVRKENAYVADGVMAVRPELIVCVKYQFGKPAEEHLTSATYQLIWNDPEFGQGLEGLVDWRDSSTGIFRLKSGRVFLRVRPDDVYLRRLSFTDRAD